MPTPWNQPFVNRLEIMMLNLRPEWLELLQCLCERHLPHAEVWAYGSRINNEAHAGSDLDLVLRDPEGKPLPLTAFLTLKEAISESNLPILVDMQDWARIPKSFQTEIEKKHLMIREPASNR